jgi:hypothetical protein
LVSRESLRNILIRHSPTKELVRLIKMYTHEVPSLGDAVERVSRGLS